MTIKRSLTAILAYAFVLIGSLTLATPASAAPCSTVNIWANNHDGGAIKVQSARVDETKTQLVSWSKIANVTSVTVTVTDVNDPAVYATTFIQSDYPGTTYNAYQAFNFRVTRVVVTSICT